MRLEDLKSENSLLFGILLAIAVISSFAALGFAGVRTILGLAVLMFLPFCLILNNFELDNGEKAVFALFSSIALFPSFAYWLGFLVPFKIAIAATFVIFIILAYAVKRWRKKQST